MSGNLLFAEALACHSIPRMTTPRALTPVTTSALPPPVGPYSPAIVVGNLVFVSGHAGRDPRTGEIADDVEAQTEQALRNIAAILEAAGSGLSHVVRCGVFLAAHGCRLIESVSE